MDESGCTTEPQGDTDEGGRQVLTTDPDADKLQMDPGKLERLKPRIEDMEREADVKGHCTVEAVASSGVTGSASVAGGATADPFHYLARQHFTSEIFKIEIQNLPRHFGFAQLKKMLVNQKLKPKKVKAVNKATYAFVTFSCEEDKESALKVLNGHKWKGNVLKAKPARPVEDPYTKSVSLKRKLEAANQDTDEDKRRREESSLPPAERLNNSVTPLWNQPYEDQLHTKQTGTRDFLRNLARQMQKNIGDMTAWLTRQRKTHGGMACQLEPIKESPILENYRNKCEFTVGRSVEGQDNTVGFRLGTYKGGQVSVVHPDACSHICQASKAIAAAFQRYIQRESSLPSYDPQLHTGHWRMLLVRTSLQGQRMAAAFLHPQQLSSEEIEVEKDKLRTFFKEGEGRDCQLTSLYLNLHDESSKTYVHLDGKEHIMEELLGFQFRISPDAFFQVNTKAAEVLYSTVADWAEVNPSTTVLDICCGTGTIGITLAKRVKKVIGIEMNQQAIDDAVYNAKTNGLTNVEYVCGKAEAVLPDMTTSLNECGDMVGIVDPPRPGIPPKVLQAIRRCSRLRRLVYVSCHPQSVVTNFIDLCRPTSNRSKGMPFRPTRAVAIDLFPHTKHCELIVLFERADRVDPSYGPSDDSDGGDDNEEAATAASDIVPAGNEATSGNDTVSAETE